VPRVGLPVGSGHPICGTERTLLGATVRHDPGNGADTLSQSNKSIQPAIFDLVFLTWALVIPVLFYGRLINGDGDLPRHLRLGSYMLEHHALVRHDFFSWTKAGQPFVAFEWLSEVLYATVYRLGGLAGVAIFAGLLLAFTYALVARFLLKRGVDPFLAYAIGTVAAILGGLHWLARPHLVTFLAVVVLLFLLERERPVRLWVYAVLFAIWANLHGGFSFGLVLIGIYLVGALAEAASATDRAHWLAWSKHYALALLVGAAATLINPNGPALPAHVVGFFGESYLTDVTNEFMSPNFHTWTGKIFLAVMLLAAGALAVSRKRPNYPRLLLILASIAFSLIAQRNIALFGLTAMAVLALHIDPEWRRLSGIGRIRAAFERDEARRRSGPWAVGLTVVMVIVALNRGSIGSFMVVPNAFDRAVFPVAAVEEARRERIEGHLFHEFIWGGYILLEWPEQKVFIDGGTDYYGTDLYREFIETITLTPGWRDTFAKRQISLALLGTGSALAHELARDSTWGVRYCDDRAVLLQRGYLPAGDRPGRQAAWQTLWACYEESREGAGP